MSVGGEGEGINIGNAHMDTPTLWTDACETLPSRNFVCGREWTLKESYRSYWLNCKGVKVKSLKVSVMTFNWEKIRVI